MGPLHDGDVVHAASRYPECIPPEASIDTPGFKMDVGANHAATSGDTLPMDLQVRPGT